MAELDKQALINAEQWLNSDSINEDIKKEIKRLKEENIDEFNDAFYKKLAFGTGGLRGVMGVGTNRMNSIVVAMATQGFATYIKEQNSAKQEIKVAIAFDSRNNSKDFATIVAKVFAGNGFKVFLFENNSPYSSFEFRSKRTALRCRSNAYCIS